ncbi:MAG TPA: HEAT repeat domain-containing protein [Planctomycetota bacterium]|nr:HEAT repeat domain-containing protein [Planctomycetota bacterium]
MGRSIWVSYATGALLAAVLLAGGCGRPTGNSSSPANYFGSGMSENGAKFVKQLKSANPAERNQAILALSNLQDPYTVPDLIEVLDDEVPWNRYNAGGALVRITNQNFRVDEKDKWKAWWKAKGDYFIEHYDELRAQAAKIEGTKVVATEGLTLYGAGQYIEAMKKMQEACQRVPSNWEYHNLLGQCYLAAGGPELVRASQGEFQLALGLDQQAMAPRLNLARTYVEVADPDWEMAQDILQGAMDLEKQILEARKAEDRHPDWQMRYVMGWVMLNRGDNTRDDFRNAMKWFRESLDIQEKMHLVPSLDCINQLGIAAHRAGLEYEAGKRILQIRAMGYDVSENFYNEVKRALEKQDPNSSVPAYSTEAKPVLEEHADSSLPRPPERFQPKPKE